MNKTLSAISVAGAFMLAAMPLLGVAGVARAQERVVVGDLDFASAGGARTFAQRLDTAAQRYCVGKMSLNEMRACREGVKAEVIEKLSTARRNDLAQATGAKSIRVAAK